MRVIFSPLRPSFLFSHSRAPFTHSLRSSCAHAHSQQDAALAPAPTLKATSRNTFTVSPGAKAQAYCRFSRLGEAIGQCVALECDNANVAWRWSTFGGCENYSKVKGCKFKTSIMSIQLVALLHVPGGHQTRRPLHRLNKREVKESEMRQSCFAGLLFLLFTLAEPKKRTPGSVSARHVQQGNGVDRIEISKLQASTVLLAGPDCCSPARHVGVVVQKDNALANNLTDEIKSAPGLRFRGRRGGDRVARHILQRCRGSGS